MNGKERLWAAPTPTCFQFSKLENSMENLPLVSLSNEKLEKRIAALELCLPDFSVVRRSRMSSHS